MSVNRLFSASLGFFLASCGNVSNQGADGGGGRGGDGGAPVDAGPAELSVTDLEVREGDYGVTLARFEVTLDASRSEPVTVDFATSDGSATEADADYTGQSGTATIAAGGTSTVIEIEVTTDRRSEPDEDFTLTLSKPSTGSIVDAEAVALIVDDDGGFDMNGDGYADIAVGDMGADIGQEVDAGRAYVFFGGETTPGTLLPANADVTVDGAIEVDASNNQVPNALGGDLSGGDVNGDGFDDLVVSVRDGNGGQGAAYVFFGSASPESESPLDASKADVILLGEGEGDFFGIRVATADVNADGFADVMVGAMRDDVGGVDAGAVFVYFGSESLSGTLQEGDADVVLLGAGAGDNLGFAVASAGDFNGDGVEDILAGANEDDPNGSRSGSAFLVFGGPDLSGAIDAADADVQFPGPEAGARMGFSVGGKIDIDGDDIDEVLIAATTEDNSGDGALDGTVYVYRGRPAPPNVILASSADVTIRADRGARLGYSVDGVGDINGDGLGDFVVGERLAPPSGSGNAHVFYGSASLTGELTYDDADVTIQGEKGNDFFGSYTSVAFDANGDGLDDFTVGATEAGGAKNGGVYLFFGTSGLSATIASDADLVIPGSDSNEHLGKGLQ